MNIMNCTSGKVQTTIHKLGNPKENGPAEWLISLVKRVNNVQ